MDTTPERSLLDQLLLRHQVEQFYNHEGALLDSREFGLNGRERLRRRRALEDLRSRQGAGGHHGHGGGGDDVR